MNWSFIGFICSAQADLAPEGDAEHSANVKQGAAGPRRAASGAYETQKERNLQ